MLLGISVLDTRVHIFSRTCEAVLTLRNDLFISFSVTTDRNKITSVDINWKAFFVLHVKFPQTN